MSRFHLRGRVVAITGGTGGFATALAPALREQGAKVALLDLNADAAVAAAQALGGTDVAHGWEADVRDLVQMQDTMAAVASHFGGVDVVMANAGLGDVAVLLAEDDPAHWEAMVDINLNGVYRTFRAAYPYVYRNRGYMLATSSMAGFIHSPLQGAYTATKAGVWALCDTWRLEVRHAGVAVGSLHPTFFKTPMTERVWANPAGYRIWSGNTKGLWKQVDIDTVVKETIRGIQRRAPHIVVPRSLRLAALAPGFAQLVVDRFGFPGATIQEAVALIPERERREEV
jgi:NAD(P)-dependent dehydrogenase (short-subunit alcohol dehydrogenase family)